MNTAELLDFLKATMPQDPGIKSVQITWYSFSSNGPNDEMGKAASMLETLNNGGLRAVKTGLNYDSQARTITLSISG